MEIVLLDEGSLRIKGKSGSVVIDPTTKTVADGVVFLVGDRSSLSKVSEFRVVIEGPGEYEVSGIKVVAYGNNKEEGKELAYSIRVDGVQVCVVQSSQLQKFHEKLTECHILIVRADSALTESSVTAVSPSILVLYGAHAQESAKIFGKEDTAPTQKLSTAVDKLPKEMEVVLLG